MAPKAEKKPVQPAKKSVAKKSSPGSRGRKKGSKKAVESYKIYIYKVHCWPSELAVVLNLVCQLPVSCAPLALVDVQWLILLIPYAGFEAGPPGHWNFIQGNVNFELIYC